MTDHHDSHNRVGTSRVKDQNHDEQEIIKEEFALIQQGLKFEALLKDRKEPMPYIPRSGRWAIDHWAIFWGVNADTINRNNEKVKYEPMKYGGTKVIDAAKFWECLERSGEVADG
ncbi:hypothetical protein [Gimesia sp.]|uniref:hypothetical protein n=1 Tax=Gimesia sp. TaxID=2024833 RepID=UPI003A92A401